jgi:hypothetical protein
VVRAVGVEEVFLEELVVLLGQQDKALLEELVGLVIGQAGVGVEREALGQMLQSLPLA